MTTQESTWGIYDIDGAGEEWYLARTEDEAIAAANTQWGGTDIECAERLSDSDLDRMTFTDEDGTKRSFREEMNRQLGEDPSPGAFASTDF